MTFIHLFVCLGKKSYRGLVSILSVLVDRRIMSFYSWKGRGQGSQGFGTSPTLYVGKRDMLVRHSSKGVKMKFCYSVVRES